MCLGATGDGTSRGGVRREKSGDHCFFGKSVVCF